MCGGAVRWRRGDRLAFDSLPLFFLSGRSLGSHAGHGTEGQEGALPMSHGKSRTEGISTDWFTD